MTVPSVGVPSTATNAATPRVAPICRNMVCAPIPVASLCGGSTEVAAMVNAGSASPTPLPPTSIAAKKRVQ